MWADPSLNNVMCLTSFDDVSTQQVDTCALIRYFKFVLSYRLILYLQYILNTSPLEFECVIVVKEGVSHLKK